MRDADILAPGATVRVEALSNAETAMGAQFVGGTIRRIRGAFAADFANPPQTPVVLVLAAMIIDQSIVDTNRPSTVDSPLGDWMMWHPIIIGGAGPITMGAIDVRAQRRLDEIGDTLNFTFTNPSADSVNYAYDLSVLVAFP